MDNHTNNIFEYNLYNWARSEFYGEIDGEFPILRSFPTGLAHRAMTWMEQLPSPARYRIALALVKRWLPRGVEIASEQLDEIEIELINKWLDKARISTPAEKLIRDESLANGLRRVRRKKLAAAVRRELTPIFGAESTVPGDYTLRYETFYNDWVLTTDIDLGGNSHCLLYSHTLSNPGKQFSREHISLLSYCGIAGQTHWSDLTDDNYSMAVAGLKELGHRFIRSVPGLVEGI